MANYSSLTEVFPDKPWPKKGYTMTSAKATKPEQRDPEKEGRIFPTPIHRGQDAIKKHKKTIDDLTGSLPIAQEDDESNFAPARIETKEHFSSTKAGYTKPFYPSDDGTEYAYAPPSFQREAHEVKLQRLMDMMESGGETSPQYDMILYMFTGVFFIFAFDTFVNLGKRLR